MIYRLALLLLCVSLSFFMGCAKKTAPEASWTFDFDAFGHRMANAFNLEDRAKRIDEIKVLLREVEPGADHSRQARHCVLTLMTALMATHVAEGDGEEALSVEGRWESRAREFLKADPRDGGLVSTLAERLHRTGRRAEAWALMEDSVSSIDLETAAALLVQLTKFVDYLESQTHGAAPRPWRERFLRIAAELGKRVPSDSPRRGLRFALVESEAKVFVRLNRLDDAESNVEELLSLDGGRPEVVDLEEVLTRARRSKR